MRTLAILGVGCVFLLGGCATDTSTKREHVTPPDTLIFGDRASEQEHGLLAPKTVVDSGGLSLPCRRIEPDGCLAFTARCRPQGMHYLSVVLWGEDHDVGQLFLYAGDTRIGGYMKEQPEIDIAQGDRAFPGRFFSCTLMIPTSMTEGRTAVRIQIRGGGQATPYSRSDKEKVQTAVTRGIYAASVSTVPFHEPPSRFLAGAAPRPVPVDFSPDPVPRLHEQLDVAVKRLLDWQFYGPEWDERVGQGRAPGCLTGCVPEGGERDPQWTPEQWLDCASRLGGNRVMLLAPEIMARAYLAKWSLYAGKPELLDRVVRALDFARVAQGANGGFDDIHERRWVGGPKRRLAGNCLEGFGQQGLPAAFLLLGDDLTRAGYLDQAVDDDGDPNTPPVPRRQAWTDLFENGRNYLTSPIGRGHAPNQDASNIFAAVLYDLALQKLTPERALGVEAMRPYIDAVTGAAPDVYGGRWFSRKGLALEPNGSLSGGFCGNYGEHMVQPLSELPLHGVDTAAAATRAIRALACFRYPSVDDEGKACLRLEGGITWRNNRTPGRIGFGDFPIAAACLGDPVALRGVQLAHRAGQYDALRLDRYWAHFMSTTVYWQRNVDALQKALQMPDSDYRFPFGDEGPRDVVWSDEQAAAVVVKYDAERLLASLNWRRGFKGQTRSLAEVRINNIARVHLTTPTLDRYATVAMETRDGFQGLYLCRYGPYWLAMNAAADRSYDVSVPAPGDWERLPEREQIPGGAPFTLPPGTTVVLRERSTSCSE